MSAVMIKEFRLPDLGEGLTESEILSWRVSVGDAVALNQVIAEVETAKAVVELPSPFAGVVTVLHEEAGTVVEVGKPIVSFEVPDDSGAAAAVAAGEEPPAQREPNLVGYGAVLEASGHPVRRRRSLARVAQVSPAAVHRPESSAPTLAVSAQASERPRSTPPVRKLARDLGIELAGVEGSGASGLITRDDVQAAARGEGGQRDGHAEHSHVNSASAQEAVDAGRAQREVRTPIKGVRKHTAAAMVSSAFTAPHVSEFLSVDVTPTMDLLARLKQTRSFADVRLTPLTFVAKAVLVALKRSPTLNARWDGERQEIAQFNYVNLGIAAATPRGLMVPNIKDAEVLSLHALAEALTNLADTARSGGCAPADLSGGTVSITNIGVFGIDAGTPILNPGEAAILAMGAVRKTPWEYQEQVALRQVMTLSLSFDHRVVDGEQGSRFLADVGTMLADPAMILTMI